MLLQEMINTLVQLVVVLLVCLPFWAVIGRRKDGFFRWLGLYAPTVKSLGIALVVFVIWSLMSFAIYIWPPFLELASGENTVAGSLTTNGFDGETIVIILMLAGIKTGLTEEIFFRGLIGKRLINLVGFWPGNSLQALIFGAVHLLIFAVPGGPGFTPGLAAAVVLFPGIAGWLMGFVNEKAGNGSIVPGWMMHALGNAISYPILAFVV